MTPFCLKRIPIFPGDFNEFIFLTFIIQPSLQENCMAREGL